MPTCTTHILREMGKTMPVLWVSSIGTRKPQLGHPAHAGRIVRRLLLGLKRAELKENKLRVLHPLLIPKAQSRFGQWLNRWLFGWQAGRELRDMGNGPIEYWCFVPNAVDLLPGARRQEAVGSRASGPRSGLSGAETWHERPARSLWDASGTHAPRKGSEKRGQESERASTQRLNESANHPIVVYYCVDDWTQFHYLDTKWMAQKERELLERADVVFAVSRYLVDKLERAEDDVRSSPFTIYYAPHGVEYEKFRRALDMVEYPCDIAGLPRPIIGFYGNIYPWVDLDLIGKLARERPEWSFVMIGGVFCEVEECASLANVRFLGRREHDELPRYCAAFDVAIIPYDLRNPRMESVSPVKTCELLAAGVPVVASDIPELRSFGESVAVAKTTDEWLSCLERQIGRSDRKEVSDSVAEDDWRIRVQWLRGRMPT